MRYVTLRPRFHQRPGQFGYGSLTAFQGGRHRHAQFGGALLAFRGGQHGGGFGDILKSIFKVAAPLAKRAMPVVLKGAKKFIKHTIKAREAGQSWGDAAQGALAPAALGAIKGVGPSMADAEDEAAAAAAAANKGVGVPPPGSQGGSGRRRKRQYQRVYKSPKRKKFKDELRGFIKHYNF